MGTKTANQDLFADALAAVVSEKEGRTVVADQLADRPVVRPRHAEQVADRRTTTPKPSAARVAKAAKVVAEIAKGADAPATTPAPRQPRTKAEAARVAASQAQEATLQAAREGRTQGTQAGTANAGRNGRKPCACQVAVDAATGKPLVATCGRDTWKTFAPGHDARLKGALIRHGLAGGKVRLGSDPIEYVATDAAGAWGFRELVAHGIANPSSKLAKKARRAQQVADAPAPKVVKAKVGRWEREGTLSADGKTFRYADKKGTAKETTKFVLV